MGDIAISGTAENEVKCDYPLPGWICSGILIIYSLRFSETQRHTDGFTGLIAFHQPRIEEDLCSFPNTLGFLADRRSRVCPNPSSPQKM